MFTYTELPDGRVSLEMDMADFEELLRVLGFALGAASPGGRVDRATLDFINRLNRTNPKFQQYELPAERSEAPRPVSTAGGC